MEREELQLLVEGISLRHFGLVFKHEARFNHRLRTTGGRYLLRSHDIEFNPKQLEAFGREEFEKIIKHELCHYHLHLQGRGYQHKDRDFKEMLSRVGGARYCRSIPGTHNVSAKVLKYICQDCQQLYERKRSINISKYVCGKCSGKLKKFIKNS
ncbi:SprT family protein [Alkalihalobacillus pseudalcaliphilus]|uniref:SprT family protein n=1 Tax=Alkalihalobacillus pseudalcaliphilus TaxID=79884 RepID=UPI00064DFDC3|nr:SprT family protein [Alkalihalobacillus pseudalcaliphilus]KMK76933.1 hypothetical protein AB990_08580 [Alkalihalobacillus pseudalcaliphilus]